MFSSSMLQGQIALMLQQQLIGQLSKWGDGLSLIEVLLQRQQKSGREIAAQALTGRIRSDVGALRQSARNLHEGSGIAKIAQAGTASIVESLKKMQKLAQDAATATPGADMTALQTAFNSHAQNIRSIIENTSYNGISLMDRGQWDADDRVTQNGNTGSIGIQVGSATRNLTLTDFSGGLLGTNPALAPDALTDYSGALSALSSALSGLITTMKMHERSFGNQASSMESEAKSVERQSRIADLMAVRSISSAGTDPASQLLFFLLRDRGKLIDDKS